MCRGWQTQPEATFRSRKIYKTSRNLGNSSSLTHSFLQLLLTAILLPRWWIRRWFALQRAILQRNNCYKSPPAPRFTPFSFIPDGFERRVSPLFIAGSRSIFALCAIMAEADNYGLRYNKAERIIEVPHN